MSTEEGHTVDENKTSLPKVDQDKKADVNNQDKKDDETKQQKQQETPGDSSSDMAKKMEELANQVAALTSLVSGTLVANQDPTPKMEIEKQYDAMYRQIEIEELRAREGWAGQHTSQDARRQPSRPHARVDTDQASSETPWHPGRRAVDTPRPGEFQEQYMDSRLFRENSRGRMRREDDHFDRHVSVGREGPHMDGDSESNRQHGDHDPREEDDKFTYLKEDSARAEDKLRRRRSKASGGIEKELHEAEEKAAHQEWLAGKAAKRMRDFVNNPTIKVTPEMLAYKNAQPSVDIVRPGAFFKTKKLKTVTGAQGKANILQWLQRSEDYCGLSERHADLWKEEFYTTVDEALLAEISEFNFANYKTFDASQLEEGRFFSRMNGFANGKSQITKGFELGRSTTMDQLNPEVLKKLFRLMATPVGDDEFQNTFLCRLRLWFASNGGKSGIEQFEQLSPLNILDQFPKTEQWLNIVVEIYQQLASLVDESAELFDEDDDYCDGLELDYRGDNGIRKLLLHTIKTWGSVFCKSWMKKRDSEESKYRVQKKAKEKDPTKTIRVEAPASDLAQEVQMMVDHLRELHRLGRANKSYMDSLKDTSVVLVEGGNASRRLSELEYGRRVENPSLTVQESVYLGEQPQLELMEMGGTPTGLFGDRRYTMEVQEGVDREPEEFEDEFVALDPYPRDKKKPSSALYEPTAGKRARPEGQDWEGKVCYHRCIGTECNEACPGRDNKDPKAYWLCARWLRNQNVQQAEYQAKRRDHLERFMDQMERELRSKGQSVPDGGDRGKKKLGEKGNRRDPPKAPLRSGQHAGGQPRREDQLIKKHQFNSQLNAMNSEEYEELLNTVMEDPRRRQLFVIEGDDEELDPEEGRYFDPSA